MNYGKRSSLPKTSRKICDMYDDGEDSKDTTKSFTSSCDMYDDSKESGKRKRPQQNLGSRAKTMKSRNASEKKRRDQFNVLIQELCSMVSTKTRKLDKSAVLRATIHFLKAHNDMVMKSEKNAINENWKPSFLSDDEFSQLMLEALDGFMIVFSQQGHILYTSDSVISLLRHLPKDLESCTIYELIHEDDRPEMFKILSRADSSCGMPDILGQRFSFSCHMKRGTLEPDKPPEYEPVRFNGSFSVLKTSQAEFTDMVTTPRYCFVATVRLLSTQLSREMATFTEKGNEFTSRHSLDWKFLFLDHRAPPIIGYLPFEVLGTSVYEYYQQDDLDKLGRCHEALMQTGEGKSCYYRFLTKGQEWIWLQTRYFITYNQWNSKPEFIVCTHQVVNYADVRNDINKELELTDSKMSGADSDSTNLWDSSASDSASLSTSVSANSSLNVLHFNTGKSNRMQSSSTDDTVSCTSSLKGPSVSHSESGPGSGPSSKASSVKRSKSTPTPGSCSQQAPHPNQAFPSQPPVPAMFQSNEPPEQVASTDSNLTPQQVTVIQLKLQEQLMMRHHKLQDAILRQQQELQQVQQQLMMAQQLMMQHHPMLGQMFMQQQEQMMRGEVTTLPAMDHTPIAGPQGAPMDPSSMQPQQQPQGQGQPQPQAQGQPQPQPQVHSNAAMTPLPSPVPVQGMMAPPPEQQMNPGHQPQMSPQHPQPGPPNQPQEAMSIEQLTQHQLSSGSIWPSNNFPDLPSNILQSATRAPFIMHSSHQTASSSGTVMHRQHLTPHRTMPPHAAPPGQQPFLQPPPHPHHPHQQQQQSTSDMPQPTMHASMSVPPGSQAVPMQDLSCLGLPTLDMASDQYMQASDSQDAL